MSRKLFSLNFSFQSLHQSLKIKILNPCILVPIVGAHVPQCHEDGTWKSKQCHGSTGLCWCVNDKGIQTSKDKVRGNLRCP